MKTLKIWTGRYISMEYGGKNGKCTRCIVAGYTKKQACELSGISYSEVTNYFSLTGNKRQLSTAVEPGLWVYDTRKFNEYDERCPIIRIK